MKRLLGLGPKLQPVPANPADTTAAQESVLAELAQLAGSGFLSALEAAKSVAEEFQQACADVENQRRQRKAQSPNVWAPGGGAAVRSDALAQTLGHSKTDGNAISALPGGESLNPLDDELRKEAYEISDLHSFRLAQLCRCLERCLYVCRGLPTASAPQSGATVSVASEGSATTVAADASFPAAGAEAQVTGLTATAEQRLNGQHGHIEAFHADLGLWRLRLEGSGTRLLLAKENLTRESSLDTAAEKARDGRSRSPRRPGSQIADTRPSAAASAVSLVELVRKAAAAGEHVLVHHIVAWSA